MGTIAVRGGCSRPGDGGRGLLIDDDVLGGFWTLQLLLLVEGRSPVAKLTPESARRSARRVSSAAIANISGLMTCRQSSIMVVAVRRY